MVLLVLLLMLSDRKETRGSGEDGQLGMEDWEGRDSACVIKSESFKDVSAVVAGSRNSLAICHDGTVSNEICFSIHPFFCLYDFFFKGLG